MLSCKEKVWGQVNGFEAVFYGVHMWLVGLVGAWWMSAVPSILLLTVLLFFCISDL